MSADIKTELTAILGSRLAGPFLFVGSGFSRRYLGLEDWKGLLSRFSVTGRPFEYFLASADGNYPKAAGLLSKEFNEYWWAADEYKSSVEANRGSIVDSTSALRLEICRYMTTLDQKKAKQSEHAAEIDFLSTLNVDGIITTNWDLFLEQVFPDYRVFIGQKELLFSNPQQIGEIYKIHGCASAPDSLVLTEKDYGEFNERNPYLAAKLITIFVEHPVIFFGYSISDENIRDLLRAISLCIGKENIEQLRKNLIFVQRPYGNDEPGISDTYLTIDGAQIPLILLKTNDFRQVFEAIGTTKRKIPARVLRYCKEQLYDLVKSNTPEDKLCVIDIDDIDHKREIEFVVGVGAKSQYGAIGDQGYTPITWLDLVHDLLYEDKNYDARQVLDSAIKIAGRNSANTPVFKYLSKIGVKDAASYAASGLKLDKWVNRPLEEYRVRQYAKSFAKMKLATVKDIVESCTATNAAAYIPFLAPQQIDLGDLLEFLQTNEKNMASGSYASSFRKLASLFDRLRFGWVT